jgi:hypothetical protein
MRVLFPVVQWYIAMVVEVVVGKIKGTRFSGRTGFPFSDRAPTLAEGAPSLSPQPWMPLPFSLSLFSLLQPYRAPISPSLHHLLNHLAHGWLSTDRNIARPYLSSLSQGGKMSFQFKPTGSAAWNELCFVIRIRGQRGIRVK